MLFVFGFVCYYMWSITIVFVIVIAIVIITKQLLLYLIHILSTLLSTPIHLLHPLIIQLYYIHIFGHELVYLFLYN